VYAVATDVYFLCHCDHACSVSFDCDRRVCRSQQLVLKSVAWAAEGSAQTKVVAVAPDAFDPSTLLPGGSGYTVVQRTPRDLAGKRQRDLCIGSHTNAVVQSKRTRRPRAGVDVFVSKSYGPFTDADRAAILAFVQRGGGWVTGGQSWWWASSNPALPITEYPGTPRTGCA
jgi:hypothetical protein